VKTNQPSPSDWEWKLFQVALLIFPLIVPLGAAGILIALIKTWLNQHREIIQQPFTRGFGVVILCLTLTSGFAVFPAEAWLGLANFVPFAVLFAAVPVLLNKPSRLRQIAWLLMIPSILVVALGLGQLFLGWENPVPLRPILGWTLVRQGMPAGRMSSVFMYANISAVYLVIVFILGLGLWIDTYQSWRQDRKNTPIWLLGFLSVTIIGDGCGLILTNSRNAWGIAFVACLIFALYLGWRWIVLGVVSAASVVIWSSWGPSPGKEWLRGIIPVYFWGRLSDELYPDRPVATLRSTQWHFAWNMMLQRPLTGWGLRSFTPLYQSQFGEWLGHPHNLFLMLFAEIGIPGTILFCGVVGWLLMKAVRLLELGKPDPPKQQLILFTYILAFAGCISFNCFDVTIFDIRVNLLGWLLLSAIAGLSKR
jgi:O-antigen ligase